MKTELVEIHSTLKDSFKMHVSTLQVRKNNDKVFDVTGKKVARRKKMDGYYFANVVPKPKDIRLYYFPVYTHPEKFNLSEELKKCLKSENCFYIKEIEPRNGRRSLRNGKN